jgi:hypothetical protein
VIVLTPALAQVLRVNSIRVEDRHRYERALDKMKDDANKQANRFFLVKRTSEQRAWRDRAQAIDKLKGELRRLTPSGLTPSSYRPPSSGLTLSPSGGRLPAALQAFQPTTPSSLPGSAPAPMLPPAVTSTFQPSTATDAAAAAASPITALGPDLAPTPAYKRPVVIIGGLVILGGIAAVGVALLGKKKKGKKGKHAAAAAA